jgi:hypothetical protein
MNFAWMEMAADAFQAAGVNARRYQVSRAAITSTRVRYWQILLQKSVAGIGEQ